MQRLRTKGKEMNVCRDSFELPMNFCLKIESEKGENAIVGCLLAGAKALRVPLGLLAN